MLQRNGLITQRDHVFFPAFFPLPFGWSGQRGLFSPFYPLPREQSRHGFFFTEKNTPQTGEVYVCF